MTPVEGQRRQYLTSIPHPCPRLLTLVRVYLSVPLIIVTSPKVNNAGTAPPGNYQATELVFINSSPEMGQGLPVPRVIKRRDDHYMRPRPPHSPNLSARTKQKIFPNLGSWKARFNRDYEKVKGTASILSMFQYCWMYWNPRFLCLIVSELEVQRFQPLDPVRGRFSPPGTSVYQLHIVPIEWDDADLWLICDCTWWSSQYHQHAKSPDLWSFRWPHNNFFSIDEPGYVTRARTSWN